VEMRGNDDMNKWPVSAKFTLELINHFENGENKICTVTPDWDRPIQIWNMRVVSFDTVPNTAYHFISHSELPCNPEAKTYFLKNDALHFVLRQHV
jgi:hypothetical protein